MKRLTATAWPLLLLSCLCGSMALGVPSELTAEADGAHLALGVGAGFSHHFGKSVDGTTSATRSADAQETSWSQPGAGLGLEADITFATRGHSDFGLTVLGLLGVPGGQLALGAMPRYRLSFATSGHAIAAVRPFFGTPATFAFDGEHGGGAYFIAGLSAGIDLILRHWPIDIGLHGHGLLINPLGPTVLVQDAGSFHQESWHLNAIHGLLVLSYRVY